MTEPFAIALSVGKPNSLGRVDEVITEVLKNPVRLGELYECIFESDAWVRMRAIDAFEKISRIQPDWIMPYIDRFSTELAHSKQPSIQWHLAQLYGQLPLTPDQAEFAMKWLSGLIATVDVDWIVSVNAMKTLTRFTRLSQFPTKAMKRLLNIQSQHKSASVRRNANKLLDELN